MKETRARDQLDAPRTIPLYNNSGGLVTYVGCVSAHMAADRGTPFEMLIWGERFFIWRSEHRQYREAAGVTHSASDSTTENIGHASYPVLC